MARKAISQDQYRLVGAYERLRRSLLELPENGVLDKQLSFWVLPTDKRLPIAFLNQPLRTLLASDLEDLFLTPGIGHKKMLVFFELLRRALHAGKLSRDAAPLDTEEQPAVLPDNGEFDPSRVSESIWSEWRDTVVRCGLNHHRLGRVAPSLRPLPSVVWQKPLSEYSHLSLSQMRGLRTHGEKRVSAILEVFNTVHEAVSTSVLHDNLDLDIAPRFAPQVTRWLHEALSQSQPPPARAIHQKLITPLIGQIEIDLGDQVATLAEERLSLSGETPPVKSQANRLGVTRARVYQLLDDCAKVMEVRWPEGRWLLAPLASATNLETDAVSLLHGVRDLFFPAPRSRETAGVAEQSAG